MFLVDVTTGALCLTVSDFYLHGVLPVFFRHTYTSAASSHSGCLGKGWHHPYDIALLSDANGFTLVSGPDTLAQFRADEPYPWKAGGFELREEGGSLVANSIEELRYEFSSHAVKVAPLLGIADRNGNCISFRYGISGCLDQIRDAFGRVVRFGTEEGRITSIEGAVDVAIRFRYDSEGHLTATTLNDQEEHRFSYSHDLLVEYSNPDGGVFLARYDDEKRSVSTWTREEDRIRVFMYDRSRRATRVIDSFGNSTIHRFDEYGRPISVTNIAGDVSETVQAEGGGVLARVDESGRVTMSYVQVDQQIVTTEYGNASTITLANASDIAQIVDAEGNSWQHRRDEHGNLVELLTPLGHNWKFKHDERGYSRDMVGPDGVSVRFSTSQDGSQLRVQDDKGDRWFVQRDEIGRVTSVSLNDSESIRAEYRGRMRTVVLPDGVRRVYGYDWRGNVVSCTDGSGKVWRFIYSPYGLALQRIDPCGFEINYYYDCEWRLILATNENGDRFENEYDSLGRIVCQIAFDGTRQEFRYDPAGRLVETLRPDGVKIGITPDDFGFPIEERFSNGPIRRTVRNASEKIIHIEDESGSVDRLYDSEGHLIQETAGQAAVRLAYTWHALPLSMEMDSRRLEYAYDSGGRLASVQEDPNFRIEFEYDQVNRKRTIRYPIGVTLSDSYNVRGQTVEQEVSVSGTTCLLRRHFAYDGEGRLISRSDERGSRFAFSHDSRGYLSHVSKDGEGIYGYLYDGAGNLTKRNGMAFEIGPGGRVKASPDGHYEYDAAGRPKCRGGSEFAYDHFGRLSSVRRSEVEFRFEYDALSRRTRKSGPDTDFHARWAGEYLMQHSSNSGDCLRYVYDPKTGALLAFAYGLEWYAVMTDYRGEVTEIISLSSGSIEWGCDPLGFEFEIRQNDLPFDVRVRGLGREWDIETGLMYQRMRYYIPNECRFLEPDPIGVEGAWNVYQFCWNQPFSYIDPLGFACASKEECDAIFADVQARSQEVDKRWGDMNKAKVLLPWSGAPPVGVGGSMGSVKSHLEEYERQQAALGRHLKRYYTSQCQTHEDASRKEAMKQYRQQESRKPVLDPRYPSPPAEITWRGAAL